VREHEDGQVAGLRVIVPDLLADARGFLCVTRDQDSWPYATGQDRGWREVASRSARGVIRGMHVRSGAGEAKLARCSRGAVLDVVTDLRPGSPTYRGTARLVLDDLTQVSAYIPAGCAHGWQALTGPADMAYTITGRYDPGQDLEIDWADPDLGISWPLPPHPASRRGMSLAEAVKLLA
jgi:dTDP-4-dehydrorhamnose 3,5-epimerase